ncbi:basic proline-rich protein-like [Iris pallida]|uniref:Basic proline-rich protein-like n=1 Tax=Iris pallida TaxID=29817 RepID=A0AAX6DNJ4_IRIPA|nr:basic proline-rich protein-like [Iris pallida]
MLGELVGTSIVLTNTSQGETFLSHSLLLLPQSPPNRTPLPNFPLLTSSTLLIFSTPEEKFPQLFSSLLPLNIKSPTLLLHRRSQNQLSSLPLLSHPPLTKPRAHFWPTTPSSTAPPATPRPARDPALSPTISPRAATPERASPAGQPLSCAPFAPTPAESFRVAAPPRRGSCPPSRSARPRPPEAPAVQVRATPRCPRGLTPADHSGTPLSRSVFPSSLRRSASSTLPTASLSANSAVSLRRFFILANVPYFWIYGVFGVDGISPILLLYHLRALAEHPEELEDIPDVPPR